jgi:hypothetical protein
LTEIRESHVNCDRLPESRRCHRGDEEKRYECAFHVFPSFRESCFGKFRATPGRRRRYK